MGNYVTVIGSLNYDILLKQKRLPLAGETYPADSVSFASGGKGANQAVQCAKLGTKTYLVGKTGPDHFGSELREQLHTYGVALDYVTGSAEPTGLAAVHVLEGGMVYATIVPGANFDFTKSDLDRLETVIQNSSILILQLEIPTEVVEYAIQKAAEAGVYVILNAAPAKELSQKAMSQVDCFVVNEVEASFYTGQPITGEASARKYAPELLARVKETVLITLGDKGSLLCETDRTVFIPAYPAPHVVETTGAGDSYIGAFASEKCRGKTNEDACRFAAKVAAVTVSGMGAQPSMPDRKSLEQFEKN